MQHTLAVLAGQPNCGKSTIFNMLTGARQHVANYPGVTVEKKAGAFAMGQSKVSLIDLPGTYSLTSYSPEEKAARQFIMDERPHLLVSVLEASSLEKSLYLCLQLLEMGRPVLTVLNMLDVAKKRGITVDAKRLSALLGVPVIETQASKNMGKAELRKAIAERRGVALSGRVVDYGELEPDIQELSGALADNGKEGFSKRWIAVKLLEDPALARNFIADMPNGRRILQRAEELRERICKKKGEDISRLITMARSARAHDIAGQCSRRAPFVRSVTEKVDAVLCNRILGPIFLIAVLFVFYHASVTLGNCLASRAWPIWANLEAWFAALLPQQGFLEDPLLTSLGVWVVKSVTSVLYHLPIFIIMFALVAILEDSGYMARIAFILDRIFNRFGLHGQSTLPLILGGIYVGGCAIPGVIATRAIPDEKARLATILIVPMMNCLAKVPLYLLLISAFFNAYAGWAMFFMGTVTLLMGLITAKILSLTALRRLPSAPFLIELPIYHVPSPLGVARQTLDRIWMFLRKIGSVVLTVSIIVFVLVTFPNLPEERRSIYDQQADALKKEFMTAARATAFKNQLAEHDIVPLLLFQERLRNAKRGLTQSEANSINRQALQRHPVYAAIALRQGADGKTLAAALRKLEGARKTLRRELRQERLENSLLGRAGKALEGATAGAGFTWRINVALLSALAAKENSAATLGALYGLDGAGVGRGMTELSGFTSLHALALMLFMALCPPCLAAAMMVKTQSASTKWMLFSIIFQMGVGLAVATLVFSGGTLLGLTGFEAMWAFYGLCLLLLLVMAAIPVPGSEHEPEMQKHTQKGMEA